MHWIDFVEICRQIWAILLDTFWTNLLRVVLSEAAGGTVLGRGERERRESDSLERRGVGVPLRLNVSDLQINWLLFRPISCWTCILLPFRRICGIIYGKFRSGYTIKILDSRIHLANVIVTHKLPIIYRFKTRIYWALN